MQFSAFHWQLTTGNWQLSLFNLLSLHDHFVDDGSAKLQVRVLRVRGFLDAVFTVDHLRLRVAFRLLFQAYDGDQKKPETMEFQINADGTWTMKGYRAFQTPPALESGTWTISHDAARNEEVVTFIRQGTLPRATIRGGRDRCA